MEEILKISLDEDNGRISVDCPDVDKAVITATTYIQRTLAQGKQNALDFLFAVSVHLLACEPTGRLEKQYCKNLHEKVAEYRDVFLQAMNENRS